jgi:hypothetical protein
MTNGAVCVAFYSSREVEVLVENRIENKARQVAGVPVRRKKNGITHHLHLLPLSGSWGWTSKSGRRTEGEEEQE